VSDPFAAPFETGSGRPRALLREHDLVITGLKPLDKLSLEDITVLCIVNRLPI
jgi:hypothetical protein